jgi:formylglycine-generating enzyme required for sulfatase activity
LLNFDLECFGDDAVRLFGGIARRDKKYDKYCPQKGKAVDVFIANLKNTKAWTAVKKGFVGNIDLYLALAVEANDYFGYSNYPALDTLASLYALKGNFQKAVEYQSKAVQIIEPRIKWHNDYIKTLDDYNNRLWEYKDKLVQIQSGAGSRQSEPKPGEVWKEPVTGMEFVWVPTGEFMRGFSGGDEDEQPVRKIRIKGFWMGRYEVTQREWKTIMNNNPAEFKKGDDYPVEHISCDDVQSFIKLLSEKNGNRFRLPTEAEWEYACKAGTQDQRYGELGDIAWFKENSNDTTHPVGQKNPNTWGLYDMLGNVYEWCQDWYEKTYYEGSPSLNPPGPSSGSFRFIRGGNCYNEAEGVRAANRSGLEPSDKNSVLGFRLARAK